MRFGRDRISSVSAASRKAHWSGLAPISTDKWLWCKRLSNEGSWQDASVCFGRGLVPRTAFRQTDHHPLRQLVHKFQIELQRPGDHDGGSRHFARSHDYSALGPALPAGIREALEALRALCRRILEDG